VIQKCLAIGAVAFDMGASDIARDGPMCRATATLKDAIFHHRMTGP